MTFIRSFLLVAVLATVSTATADPILPQEASRHVGETISVRGLVEQVSFSKGNAFLNFGGRYPNHVFTGFVRARDVEAVGGIRALQALSGQPVTITGTVEIYKGRPEIVITKSDQISK